MGRYQGDDRRDQGFPDEFGRDLFADPAEPEQEKPLGTTPNFGYLTRQWFGPFLLGPFGRREKGHC